MHEGHRQRLLAKLESGQNLYEHEILEMLLFNAYPRRDTNPIAHALLTRFASLNEILNASIDELCTVEGVGLSVAQYLRCIGLCVERGGNTDCFCTLRTTAEFRKFIASRFRTRTTEFLEFYFIDKNCRLKRIATYNGKDESEVTVGVDEIMKLISVYRPANLYIAHNHIRTDSTPSIADDELTKQVQIICSMNKVNFCDHCIYAKDDDIYSYFVTDRLQKIKEKYTIENLINGENGN